MGGGGERNREEVGWKRIKVGGRQRRGREIDRRGRQKDVRKKAVAVEGGREGGIS